MFFIFLAALLWGVTNPLLKRYSRGLERQTDSKKRNGVLDDIKFLLKRPKYLVVQGLNLCGSVAFFFALRDVSVSIGSIATNSLAFLITVVVSVFVLKEGDIQPRTYLGMFLVLLGTTLCTLSK